MTIGLLTIVLSFFSSLTWRVKSISRSYLDAQNRVSYIKRIRDFMETPTEESWPGKQELAVTEGDIRFDNVSFAYKDGKETLRDFSLHVNAGERFALCGASGCGKTTLGYLLIGFYPVAQGDISIDGQKLADCTLHSIRQRIGMVSQDVLLFEGNIRENLLLGKPDARDAEIRAALEQAGIWQHVASLPEGMNTILGADGAGLSGGQKQRIAIARIYLRNPKIIIFDEATSSLDDATERQIHEAWKAILAKRTAIVIAHKQSAVMLCDRAAILENGRIIETGAPGEMAKSSARFKALFSVKGEEADAV
jgi:ABC-type multidrug transport system fused ATPase/permease subunit